MQLKSLLISSIIGVVGMISCIRAKAIEVIYTGENCDCQKKLNYLVNMPTPPEPKYEEHNEYGYNIQRPIKPKARVTYSFDFMAEEPKKPMPDVKWDLFATIDRIMSPKKDCLVPAEEPKSCGCNRYALADSYVSPESSAARFTRNSEHSNSIDNTDQSSAPTAQIMAIFLEPLRPTKSAIGFSKSRNKRDISRLFMRPRIYEKRSDRLVKKYSKHLKDVPVSQKRYFNDAAKPTRSRSIPADTAPGRIRPLQQLRRSFLTLPSLRKKRDIKGEYDLIEKERKQIDLTLPEIIQYMPETLQPDFKRNQCHFGQRCQRRELSESTTKTTPTKVTTETTNVMTTTESKTTTQDSLSVTEANTLKDEKEEKQIDNSINTAPIKRKARDYRHGGCPIVSKHNNPTPNPSFTFEPIPTERNSYGVDPVPQQYVGSSYNPAYASAIIDNNLEAKNTYTNPAIEHISHAQLDQIIASIVDKHSAFIEASSHPGGALVDPPTVQRQQAKYFFKSLAPWNDLSWSSRDYPKDQVYLRRYQDPVASYA